MKQSAVLYHIQDIKTIRPDLWKSFTYGGVNITGFQLINRQTRGDNDRVLKILTELGEDDLTVSIAIHLLRPLRIAIILSVCYERKPNQHKYSVLLYLCTDNW